jgi:hypothetical protein
LRINFFGDIKSFFYDSDFIRKEPKKMVCYSIALKIASFVASMLQSISPIFFIITSLSLFSFSIFVDYKMILGIYKIMSNLENEFFSILEKKAANDPYEIGYRVGRVVAISIFKTNFSQKFSGFYDGFKHEFEGLNLRHLINFVLQKILKKNNFPFLKNFGR